MEAATFSAAERLKSQTATLAPAFAASLAIAPPMEPPPPVTNTMPLDRSIVFISPYLICPRVQPPSMVMTEPVIVEAAGDAMNATAWAMSVASCSSPSGIAVATRAA